jgi:hypothetical protein
MYNVVFGVNPATPVILMALGITRENFAFQLGRFRDAFVHRDEIVVYTRNGGNNRDCFERAPRADCPCSGCAMRFRVPMHADYLRDKDDTFDSTYASIWYRINPGLPPDLIDLLKGISRPEEWDPDARWRRALDELKHMTPAQSKVAAEKLDQNLRVTTFDASGKPVEKTFTEAMKDLVKKE